MKTRFGLVLAATAATALLPLTATQASAAETGSAELGRSVYLVDPASSSFAPTYLHRSIYLAGADYRWQTYLCRSDQICVDPGRQIALKPGTYSWDCALTPMNGYYNERCTLQTAGFPAAVMEQNVDIPGSAHYNFGSSLEML